MSQSLTRLVRSLGIAVLAAFVLSLGVPAASAAATGAPDTRADEGKETSKKKDKKGKGDAAAKEEKEEPKEPPFEKAIKGAREVKGLFNVYIKDEEAKYLMEIAPDQLGVTYLLNPTLVSGVGQGFLYPSDMWPEYPVQLQKVGKMVRLIHINPNFRVADKASLKPQAALAAPDAIVSQAKLESQPHPDRKSVLVDMSSLFLGDLEGMSLALKYVLDTPYGYDGGGSSFVKVSGYPENLDFDTMLHFKTQEAKIRPVYAADPRSMLIRFHYSISKLPGEGYRARLADDRVGHFLALMDDYTDESLDTPAVRYVTRWRLEKKDPGAALSEPVKPIVYYLENTIPPEYRDAVKRGIEGWNAAFETAGFKNAIQAKDQPADPDWDAADVRYASIRWIVAPGAGFAQGPSRINPYTGEIFDADIRFSADLVRGFHQDYVDVAAPTGRAFAGATPEQAALIRSLTGWTDMLGPFSLETLMADALPEPAAGWAPPGARPDRSFAAMGYCDFARGFMQQMAVGYNVLQARGQMTPAKELAYVNEALTYITLHEVGHTLGLRHNFKSSSALGFDQIQDAALTEREGITGSVMDYVPVNLAPKGKTQGQFFQSAVGAYDKWAIEYAYKPVSGGSTEAEKAELERIASRVAQPGLAYGTDEDSGGMDPMVNVWDLSSDSLAYYRNNADIFREMVAGMEQEFSEPGTRYQKLRTVFGQALGEMFPAAVNVPKAVGGISHNRDHIGDPGGRVPYVPVPAARQREALGFLTKEIFGPDALKVSPQLLNKLAIERLPDLQGTVWQVQRNDFPLHNVVLLMQSIPMNRMYGVNNLGRLNDMEARTGEKEAPMHLKQANGVEARTATKDKDIFTMSEMFAGVRKAVWSELQTKENVNSFRRNLQRMHLEKLVDLAVGDVPGAPEDARTLARADLTEIRRGIDATLSAGKVDPMTRAHLDETKARASAALAAGLDRIQGKPSAQ
jgi:hypothetical protein